MRWPTTRAKLLRLTEGRAQQGQSNQQRSQGFHGNPPKLALRKRCCARLQSPFLFASTLDQRVFH
jgi:hypothetical protein